jgi:hypothetical protein
MQAYALKAAALYRRLGQTMELYYALCFVGFNAFVGIEEAERAMDEAAALERPEWPARMRAFRLIAQGQVHVARDRLAAWRASHHQASVLARSAGAHWIAATATGTAARADLWLGEADKALATTSAMLEEERSRRGGLLAYAWGNHAWCLSYRWCLSQYGDPAEVRQAWGQFFEQNRTADWDRIDEFCNAFVAFAVSDKRYATAGRLRGCWLRSLVRRGYSPAVTERFRLRVEAVWGAALKANLDDFTLERLRVEGEGLNAEAVCALTMETTDRPP